MADAIPTLEKIFLIEGDGANSMAGLEKAGEEHPVPSIRPDSDDIAALIYTSGTTGDPKGVLLSHGNFTSNTLAGRKMYPELETIIGVSLSILPWAHSYGQTAELYSIIYLGGSIGFMEDITTLASDMAQVKPTWLIAVPRVFNKIYDGLWSKMNETGGLPKKLFVMGVESAKKRRELAEKGKTDFITNLKFRIADRIVLQKIRNKLGGRLMGSTTASAMMNREITQFFFDIGVPLYDCYGLSETSPAITESLRGKYGSYEIPKKFIYITENFSLENGTLTQTMKVKRRVVLERYRKEIEALYTR